MVFAEKKTKKGYTYQSQDIGDLAIVSSVKLDSDTLDGVVGILLRDNITAGTIAGEVKHAKGVLSYTFKPAKQWEENTVHDTDESWNDTHTSIPKPESASTAKHRSRGIILNWCKRFVVAFRTAWCQTRPTIIPERPPEDKNSK